MHERKMRRTLSLVAAACLVLSAARTGFAQDAAADTPSATGAPAAAEPAAPARKPLGPGAIPAPAKKPAAKAAAAPKGISLSPITPVAAAVHVADKVLEQCRLQTLLPQAIAERSSEVVLTEAPGGAMRLELKIVDVHAPSGGFFSGPKWITVDGRLLQGKTVKGTFTAKETSMASATACGMLSKVVTVLAGDIAAWLQNPSQNSKLGRAR